MKNKCDVSLLLIFAMFLLGTVIALFGRIHISSIMDHYSYNVLVIMIIMELFTNLITETGIMQLLAVKIAVLSRGRKRDCLVLFGIMMFFISAFLNNITAVMMILPIVIVLLKSLDVDKRYVSVFFAVILALSNTGGAASPVGDFPAIVIMTSGITTFIDYLVRAMPLFLLTSVALIVLWGSITKFDDDDQAIRRLAVMNLKSQYKNNRIRYRILRELAIVFVGMFLAWSCIPQDTLPPEVIAILGYSIAMILCSVKGICVLQKMDLKPVLTIGSFLFLAEVISQTGILGKIAKELQDNVSNPKMLIISIMFITAIASGIFSAGPTAAAMMPIVVDLCKGPLMALSNWVAVAYAAAICAGSSLFMWSATAGFILSGKVNEARILESEKNTIEWGCRQYWAYGFINFSVQLFIAIVAMACIL